MKRSRSPGSSPPGDDGGDGGSGDADDLNARQPKISRKIRACQACQHRKVKCHVETGKERCTRCTRCTRLDLKCVVNKSLQTLLDGENEWKTRMEAKVDALQTSLAEIQRALNLRNTGAGAAGGNGLDSAL